MEQTKPMSDEQIIKQARGKNNELWEDQIDDVLREALRLKNESLKEKFSFCWWCADKDKYEDFEDWWRSQHPPAPPKTTGMNPTELLPDMSNRKLAEYMGFHFLEDGSVNVQSDVSAYLTNWSRLMFDARWDWLFPVLSKLTQHKWEDGDTAYLRTFGERNQETGQLMVRFNRCPLFQAELLIDAAYMACVDLVTFIAATPEAPEAKRGLNLAALDAELDKALASETPETLTKWLQEKRAATPPAGEAEDAEAFLRSAMESVTVRTHNGLNQLSYAFVPAIVKVMTAFAHAHAAKAVEDERQRLIRLVEEEIKLYSIPLTEEHYKDEALRQDRNTWRSGVVFGLKKVASWLTVDVGEKG